MPLDKGGIGRGYPGPFLPVLSPVQAQEPPPNPGLDPGASSGDGSLFWPRVRIYRERAGPRGREHLLPRVQENGNSTDRIHDWGGTS